MKRSVFPVLGVAAILASMVSVSAMAMDRHIVQAQTTTEDGQQVKVFDLGSMDDGRCQLGDHSILKYYKDGSVTFDGKVQCRPHIGKYEHNVTLEADFLSAASNHQLFDKQYSRDHITRNEWVEWKMQELGNAKLSDKWDRVERIRVDLDHLF